jgi:signal transduction histidine kinase
MRTGHALSNPLSPMLLVNSDSHDQLVRGLAHRMNNILSLFHGYLGLMMDDKKLDAVTREGLAKIKIGAQAATDLMERTTALVRPASAIWREISLCDLLRQLRPTFESTCRPGVRITIECADDLPRVWADPSRVRMAMVELVRNACEAANHSVIIHVRADEGRVQGELFNATAGQPEHWLSISIIDDGAGIPISEAERIYEPFYSLKKNAQNAGLGLSVAAGCARQLSGKLTHRSRKGETTFELTLPSRVAQAGELSAVA